MFKRHSDQCRTLIGVSLCKGNTGEKLSMKGIGRFFLPEGNYAVRVLLLQETAPAWTMNRQR